MNIFDLVLFAFKCCLRNRK